MGYFKSFGLPKTHCSTLWHPRHPWQGHLHRTDPLISEVACEWVEDELLAQGLGRNLAEMLPEDSFSVVKSVQIRSVLICNV